MICMLMNHGGGSGREYRRSHRDSSPVGPRITPFIDQGIDMVAASTLRCFIYDCFVNNCQPTNIVL